MFKNRITLELWRHALPVLWLGMIVAISFVEAPLKFQAPGITIPLGLGIGRLVFGALNMIEALLLITFSLLAFFPTATRLTKGRLYTWLALVLVFVLKVAVVRPPLNARTDLVIAGAEPGQSPWHYIYIGLDLVTMVLLLVIALQAGKAIRAILAETTAPNAVATPER